LQIHYTVLDSHRPDGDARIELFAVEVESADGTGIDTSTLLFKARNELDGLYLRCA
jgi:hypothetical protein